MWASITFTLFIQLLFKGVPFVAVFNSLFFVYILTRLVLTVASIYVISTSPLSSPSSILFVFKIANFFPFTDTFNILFFNQIPYSAFLFFTFFTQLMNISFIKVDTIFTATIHVHPKKVGCWVWVWVQYPHPYPYPAPNFFWVHTHTHTQNPMGFSVSFVFRLKNSYLELFFYYICKSI